jgi:hypothetical protein
MITVMGEALMHLSPAPDETTLHAMPGGSALNIAVAVARLGYPAALMARLSRDSSRSTPSPQRCSAACMTASRRAGTCAALQRPHSPGRWTSRPWPPR